MSFGNTLSAARRAKGLTQEDLAAKLFVTRQAISRWAQDKAHIGIVREDKSLIRHRVFATKLKEGCAAEYKRRHDGLIEARGDKISEGPESNFTIWNANGYIFGYCELVKSFDHEMTEDEKTATIAWETRQLEIMDWLTDDVDWMTGEKHDHIQLVVQQ